MGKSNELRQIAQAAEQGDFSRFSLVQACLEEYGVDMTAHMTGRSVDTIHRLDAECKVRLGNHRN
jgi:uncharacterized ferritin-like protein (DUF455 family)